MKQLSARYKKLKSDMAAIDIAVPGTLRIVYQTCGKQNCKCYGGEQDDMHGPYQYWDRKVKGKTKSVSVTSEQKKFIQKGIRNRKKLEKLMLKLLAEGSKISENLKIT